MIFDANPFAPSFEVVRAGQDMIQGCSDLFIPTLRLVSRSAMTGGGDGE
ncbi:hypothetical protein ACIQVC_41045 [Streptomyces sp. NPDC101112]